MNIGLPARNRRAAGSKAEVPMSHRMTSAWLRQKWRRLFTERDGNVTITFALAFIPLMGLVGAAVDYSRASAIRTAMQTAADTAALAVARNVSTLTTDQIQTQSDDTFRATFSRSDISNLTVTGVYTTTGGTSLTVTANATMKTTFLGIMGIPEMQLGTKAVSAWGNKRLRVALVLDTTGSMNDDGKIGALKTATSSLLDQLKAAGSDPEDVYVSIIPFSKDINVDPANYNASWIDWTDWDAEPPILASSKPSNWSSVGPGSDCPFPKDSGSTYNPKFSTYGFGCSSTPTGTDITFKVPSSGTYSGYICPSTNTADNSTYDHKNSVMYNGCYNSTAKANKVTTGSSATCNGLSNCTCSGSGSNKKCTQTFPGQYDHTWIPNSHSTWNGCITDRGGSTAPSGDYDRLSTAPGTTAASKFPAEQYANCSPALKGLSHDWASMKTLVNGLYPNGSTNQPIGLVWGWQSLVGGGPFTVPAKPSGYVYQDAIILLSDGLNTQDRWYGNGYGGNSEVTSVDKRMYDSSNSGAGTCANVKASGTILYTIHVNTGGDPTSLLLKNCASTTDKFFTVTAASQIGNVFTQIGTSLSQLHISQ
jgi:Flp pilus assembly protein TadG